MENYVPNWYFAWGCRRNLRLYHKGLRLFLISSTFVLIHDIFLLSQTRIPLNGDPTASRGVSGFNGSLRMGRSRDERRENQKWQNEVECAFFDFHKKMTIIREIHCMMLTFDAQLTFSSARSSHNIPCINFFHCAVCLRKFSYKYANQFLSDCKQKFLLLLLPITLRQRH